MNPFKLLIGWLRPPEFQVAAAIGGAAIGSAVIGGVSANSAADAQESAANTAANTQLAMFNTTNAEQQPWIQSGANAINQLSAGTQPGGQFTHTFNASDLANGLAPNYDFQLQQGLGAVNNQASVTGGLVGGNALKGISDYAQGSAASAYQQAFDNYNTNQTNVFNRLASIAGLGQTSLGQTTTAGMTTAGNVGSAQLASGAAQAAGYTATGNSVTGGLNNISSMYALNGLTGGSLFGNSSGFGSGYIPSSQTYADSNLLTS